MLILGIINSIHRVIQKEVSMKEIKDEAIKFCSLESEMHLYNAQTPKHGKKRSQVSLPLLQKIVWKS